MICCQFVKILPRAGRAPARVMPLPCALSKNDNSALASRELAAKLNHIVKGQRAPPVLMTPNLLNDASARFSALSPAAASRRIRCR